ncbi:MAG: hypothetical protein V1917_03000 [Candidatus Gottesmanbacteria bacterium]
MRAIRRFLRMYQSFVVSGTVIVFCCIALFAGIIPGVTMTIRFFQETQSLRTLVKTLEEKKRVLDELDVDMLTSYAKAAIAAVPADKSLGSLFSTVDALTAREGVTVTAVSLGHVGSVATDSAGKLSVDEQKIGVNIVPFSIVIEGEINRVRNVVDQAVKIRRFFRVRSFDLLFDTKSGITKSTLTMDAYYVPDPKQLGKVTDPLKTLSAEEIEILDKVASFPLLTPEVMVAPGSATIQTEPVTSDPFAP